jgi:hypothetical protein
MNNGSRVEAHDSLVVLDDVDADTFVGFCEFAYTSNYRSRMTELEPEIVSSSVTAIEQARTL